MGCDRREGVTGSVARRGVAPVHPRVALMGFQPSRHRFVTSPSSVQSAAVPPSHVSMHASEHGGSAQAKRAPEHINQTTARTRGCEQFLAQHPPQASPAPSPSLSL
jgi:hypothetical protein